MTSKIEENEREISKLFTSCTSNEEVYKALISLGESAPSLDSKDKVDENRVHGCQSQLYIVHQGSKEAVHYQADSDALISKGLAILLTTIYNGASAEAIVKTPLKIFKEIDLFAILSPTRVTGVDGLEKRMKMIAVNYLI